MDESSLHDAWLENRTYKQAGLAVWVPALFLAHVWSIVFICKALAVLNPALWLRMKQRVLQVFGRGECESSRKMLLLPCLLLLLLPWAAAKSRHPT
jgi:hypothetical protein